MKLTIKSNGTMRSATIEDELTIDENDNYVKTGNVRSVEIDFNPPSLYSDFELWLEDDNGKLVDYKKINITKRNRMQMSC